MHIERKKEILRTRKVFWQKKLMTVQPNGLNKRIGWTKKTLYSFAYVNDVLEHKLWRAFSLAQLDEIRERSNQNIIM